MLDHNHLSEDMAITELDITERKQLEQRLLVAAEACPTAMVMIDCEGTIVMVNREAERMFGYQRHELLGQPIDLLVPERFRPQHTGYIDRFFSQPATRPMGAGRDLWGRRKDGSEFPAEIGLSLVETAQGLFALGGINDITFRKELESKLKRANEELDLCAAELSQRNQELEQFAYIAAHDLQEPLRQVASCCHVLAEEYADKLDEDGREWITFAVDGATHMRRLVTDLLEFSRVGTRGNPAEPIDANQACQLALTNLADTIQEHDARILSQPLPTILANASQLVQLFQNLVGNSLKYCGDNKPVVEIGAHPEEGRWQFYVKDNGIGIAPENHERIFQIFQRLHRNGDQPGTGIGLAICKKIVERFGGRLWLESQCGQGSTFFFTLPAIDSVNKSELRV